MSTYISVNFSNKLGAVGFISRIFPWLIPSRVVRVNPDTGEFIRDPKTGLCILCRPGEPGELVAQIDARNPVRDFSGYADKRSTAKKVVRDVLKKGDACFRLVTVFIYWLDVLHSTGSAKYINQQFRTSATLTLLSEFSIYMYCIVKVTMKVEF